MATANVQTYLRRVQQLYADVREWMTALEPDVQISESPVNLVEQATGPYEAKSLEIARPGRASIRLVPRGRYMVGAEGRVEVRSRFGRETLVWVRTGGPAIGFRPSTKEGEILEELVGRPMFPGIAEGWAWSDDDRLELKHLDCAVFCNQVLDEIGANV